MSGRPANAWARVRLALGILIVAAAGTWAWMNLERVSVTEQVGFRGEARRNPYLAAMGLARELGVAARELPAIADLRYLPQQVPSALVLPRQRREISPGQRDRIIAWMEGGRHLVIEAEYPRAADPMLDALGVTRAPSLAPNATHASAFTLPGRDRPVRASMHSPQRFAQAPPGALSLEDARGVQIASFPRGQGRVTVLTDLAFARNALIGQLDHAELFWWIMQQAPRPHQVLFLNSPSGLSLVGWLTREAGIVLVSGAIALALWLWRTIPRLGPLAPDPIPARRRLLDHLRASARFHWARRGRARLLEAAREACFARIVRSHPEFTGLGHAEQVQWLAKMTEITAAEAALALRPLPATDALAFTATVHAMQQVHARLGGVERPTEK